MRLPACTLLLLLILSSISALAQWEYVTPPGRPNDFYAAMAGRQGELYVAYNSAITSAPSISRSTDLGQTWLRADSTLPFTYGNVGGPNCITFIGNRIFAGFNDGVFRSTNSGATWTKTATFGGYTEAYSLGTKDTTLYVGYYNVARSSNYGTNWTPASFGLPASITMAVVASGNNVLAASDGVFRSTDGGVNFASVNTRIHSANTMDLVLSGTTLFAANSDSGVFRSTDFGTTWQLVNNGLVGSSRRARWLKTAPGLVFVMTDSGLYASKDNGAKWVFSTDNLALTPPMAVVGDYLFTQGTYGLMRQLLNNFIPAAQATAVVNGAGIYTFNPTGNITGVTLNLTSTSPAATQLEVKRFTDAAINPSFSGTPPATTSSYRWVITSSLAGYAVTGTIRISLSAFGAGVSDPTSVKIYKRSTSGSGQFVEIPTTYDAGANEIVGTITGFSEFIFGGPGGALDVDDQAGLPESIALEQNYPNPFNPLTRIELRIKNSEFLVLKVYDVLGREVATLLNETRSPGTYTVDFDGRGLASGVYMYRLTAGDFVASKRMLLLK